MFLQMMEGRTGDPAALYACFERWQRDVQPGAIGYLASTEGVSDTGDVVILAQFTDREAAMANSARPEQSAWWAEAEGCFDGPVTFHETEDVTEIRHGDVQRAKFVQVMEGRVTDRSRARELDEVADTTLTAMRPDLLGVVTAYFDDGRYASMAYFTNEHDARRNEAAPVPEEIADQFEEWGRVMSVDRYIDLTDPVLVLA